MTQKICEISASSWFYYKEICYDARSHERKKKLMKCFNLCLKPNFLGTGI